MAASGDTHFPQAVIQSKLVPPPLPDRLVARPRLDRRLAGLIDDHRVVWICATAGAGKTTAVHQAVALGNRRVAWLTVDDTDAAAGRLLTYVEAALAQVVPGVAGIGAAALRTGIQHREAAGLLAEAVRDEPLVLVLDELERVATSPPALGVLSALLRYAPPAMRLVLVSRWELDLELDSTMFGRVGALGETELTFTREEAAHALEQMGGDDIDAEAAVEATGGWVTGVLFEAWRAGDAFAGLGGETDPLYGYLSSQILARLSPTERDFLTHTAVLDQVTVARAQSLGIADAGRMLEGLRAKRLPATWHAAGRELRCHTRFREYLQDRLSRLGESEAGVLHAAHARLLLSEGHAEDAVEALLRAGLRDEARPIMVRTVGSIVERLDYPIVERWLAAVPATEPDELAQAELMVAIGRHSYTGGAAVGDRLGEAGRAAMARSFPRTVCLLAWCYWHVGRLADAREVALLAKGEPEASVGRYLLSLCFDDVIAPGAEPPTLGEGPLDALIIRLHWAHGRFSELREPPASRWAAAVADPLRISALLGLGLAEEAVHLSTKPREEATAAGWLDVLASIELQLELERGDEAWEELERGRHLIAEADSVVYEMMAALLEVRLRLEHDRRPREALALLDRIEETTLLRSYRWLAEQAATLRGIACLREHQDEQALSALRAGVQSMLDGERIHQLPAAAVYLSEAEWRAGNEAEADRAAETALTAARRQGSSHRLLQALVELPQVAARCIDAEADRDAAWHGIGRALMSRGSTTGAVGSPPVQLREFGELTVLNDATPLRPRIKKSQELLAYLASRPQRHASRDELLDALFEGRSDPSARSYLRQAIHRLREVLPPQVQIVVDVDRVALKGDLLTDSARLETLLARAAGLEPDGRLRATLEALAIADAGEYLPGVGSVWAQERRDRLSREAAEARLRAAELLSREGRYREASSLLDGALSDDPYSERGWQLRMSLADAVGDGDGVIAAYRQCCALLEDLGLSPSAETRELVHQLRIRR